MSSRRSLALACAVSMVVAACGGVTPSGSAPVPSPSVAGPPSGGSVATGEPLPTGAPACTGGPVAAAAPWWQDRVFYEVFVRSFADSDGDGIGDLRGLIERLDYLNDGAPGGDDLGVTALWLMPVAQSPSYHGYDVTDYRTIETDYGSNADFVALVEAARARGIEIIVDLVMNHTSVEHPWFADARKADSARRDWYVWAEEHPGFSGPGGRPVWHASGDDWYYGYFWEGMPDLDLANAEVTAELESIGRFWLEEMGVAGFRLDAARHLIEDGGTLENTPETHAWLQGFRRRAHETKDDALVLGEVWDATSNAARYVREGSLDLTFDFGLAGQMLSAVRFGDAESLRIIQTEVTEAYPAGGYASFLTNHDQDRVMDVVGRDPALARQAATLLLTGAGVPFVYYGEELGLRGRKPDERIRTPLPWTGEAPGHGFTTGEPWEAFAEDVETANVGDQMGDPASLLAHYRSLIALRAEHPALLPGAALLPVEASVEDVYAVLRHDPASGTAVVVVSNLTDEPVRDVRLDLAEGPLCGAPAAAVLLGAAGAPGDPDTAQPPGDPVVTATEDPGGATAPADPGVTATGGVSGWRIGDLGPHQDLILELVP